MFSDLKPRLASVLTFFHQLVLCSSTGTVPEPSLRWKPVAGPEPLMNQCPHQTADCRRESGTGISLLLERPQGDFIVLGSKDMGYEKDGMSTIRGRRKEQQPKKYLSTKAANVRPSQRSPAVSDELNLLDSSYKLARVSVQSTAVAVVVTIMSSSIRSNTATLVLPY